MEEVTLTKENLLTELNKDGTLMDLLKPGQFTYEGQVADKIAEEYVKNKKMNLTQLRKFFHALKEKERAFKGKKEEEELDQKSKDIICLHIPELAYACGRELIPKDFYNLMHLCLSPKKLIKIGDLRILMQFLTAILAYYKFHKK